MNGRVKSWNGDKLKAVYFPTREAYCVNVQTNYKSVYVTTKGSSLSNNNKCDGIIKCVVSISGIRCVYLFSIACTVWNRVLYSCRFIDGCFISYACVCVWFSTFCISHHSIWSQESLHIYVWHTSNSIIFVVMLDTHSTVRLEFIRTWK